MAFVKTKFVRPVFMGRARHLSIGYLSSNSFDTTSKRQASSLHQAGCSLVFQDSIEISNKKIVRSQLKEAVSLLKEGDELVVFDLKHLSSSADELLNFLLHFHRSGKFLRSLDGTINSRNQGDIYFSLIGLISTIRKFNGCDQSDMSGAKLISNKAKLLNLGGRPKTNVEKERLVMRLRDEGTSYRSIRNQTGLSLSTIRRIIIDNQVSI